MRQGRKRHGSMDQRYKNRRKKQQADLAVQNPAQLFFTEAQLGYCLELVLILIQIAVQPEVQEAACRHKEHNADKETYEHHGSEIFNRHVHLIIQGIELISLGVGQLVQQLSPCSHCSLLTSRSVPGIVMIRLGRIAEA
ncbi:hypothetical protein D3C80_1544110 [compost metagenome]